mmetsp:Transcript_23826/g.53746  ORF Transcript_23826/g.53746 Transcript_23826/m.53746 type:complete len:224 (-) Transcript_23826:77-748(-)
MAAVSALSASQGWKTCLPMHDAPANFLVMRIGSQFSLSERKDRRVVPADKGKNPLEKSVMIAVVYASSSAVHFPLRSCFPLESGPISPAFAAPPLGTEGCGARAPPEDATGVGAAQPAPPAPSPPLSPRPPDDEQPELLGTDGGTSPRSGGAAAAAGGGAVGSPSGWPGTRLDTPSEQTPALSCPPTEPSDSWRISNRPAERCSFTLSSRIIQPSSKLLCLRS